MILGLKRISVNDVYEELKRGSSPYCPLAHTRRFIGSDLMMQALGSTEHASISRDHCVAKFSVKRLAVEGVCQCLAELEQEQQGGQTWIHILIVSKDFQCRAEPEKKR